MKRSKSQASSNQDDEISLISDIFTLIKPLWRLLLLLDEWNNDKLAVSRVGFEPATNTGRGRSEFFHLWTFHYDIPLPSDAYKKFGCLKKICKQFKRKFSTQARQIRSDHPEYIQCELDFFTGLKSNMMYVHEM